MTKSKRTGTSEASDADSEVLEEDWSHLMNVGRNRTITSTASHDDNNDNDNDKQCVGDVNEFSYYDTVTLPLSDSVSSCPPVSNKDVLPSPPLAMQLRCVRRLTPLDMLDLYNGERDATGNRLWMGAVCFLECMVRPLHPPVVSRAHPTTRARERAIARARALQSLRTELFDKRRVLELGCGTGASLIAIGLVGSQNSRSNGSSRSSSGHHPPIRPTTLTLTDNDPKVLALCEMNCRLNFQRQTIIDDVNNDDCTTVDYAVKRLDWGEFCSSSSSSSIDNHNGNKTLDADANASIRSASQDTVVATDVIYDVAAIPVLFAAAAKLLVPGGALVVAHVPRAAVEDDNDNDDNENDDNENENDNDDNENDNENDDNDHSFSNPAIGSVQSRLEQKLLDAASEHGFVRGGAIAGILGSSLEVLCHEHDDSDNDNEPACILRPSTIAGIWTSGSHGAGDKHNFSDSNKHISVPVPTLVSSDYDYEDLEACGASILVFVKRTE